MSLAFRSTVLHAKEKKGLRIPPSLHSHVKAMPCQTRPCYRHITSKQAKVLKSVSQSSNSASKKPQYKTQQRQHATRFPPKPETKQPLDRSARPCFVQEIGSRSRVPRAQRPVSKNGCLHFFPFVYVSVFVLQGAREGVLTHINGRKK